MMRRIRVVLRRGWCVTTVLLAVLAGAAARGQVTIKPSHADGLYTAGEPIVWDVRADNVEGPLKYTVKRDGMVVVKEGEVELSEGAGKVEGSIEKGECGALFLEVKGTVKGKQVRVLAGALVDPGKINPTLPLPADFKNFWDGKIATLAAVPMNAKVTGDDPAATQPAKGRDGVEYVKVELDNINGAKIRAQLAKPKGEKGQKYPALLILQWAGVYGLPESNVTGRAREGWLVMNVMPHDLPLDQPADFYKQAAATNLKDYWTIGSSDRETSYFLQMYLGDYRAAEYLTSRDDWDGKTLVVIGTSMGGQQALVTAGLHPKVTAVAALVPSSCDAAGPTAGHAAGFPDWAAQAKWKNNPKIVETSRYFDPENFAHFIKCPAMVGMGLIDETCPPRGVYAAVNQLAGPKNAVVLPGSDHQGHGGTQEPFNKRRDAWLAKLVKGEPADWK